MIQDARITREEIERAIRSMKKGKAPGVDGIPVEAYREVAGDGEFVELLTDFFNMVFRKDIVPKEWGMGVIITLYKGKGEKSDPTNYRGITLLGIGGKILPPAGSGLELA